MELRNHLSSSYQDAIRVTQEYCAREDVLDTTVTIAEKLADIFKQGGKALVCGNGGSACDAMHFAEEFTGRYRQDRLALPVISLTDPSHVTCVGNDYGFEEIFARGVEAYGKEGDLFVGISTSGNSENVIRAVQRAKHAGLVTVALLGKDGGKLSGECDYEFVVPEKTSDRIQEVHMMILHIIIEGVERILFPSNY
jgi:D-sedoheptulose 7-phosphate isomerase